MDLKEEYNRLFISSLAEHFEERVPGFKKQTFKAKILDGSWKDRALKERMRHITNVISDSLPFDFQKQINILTEIAPNYKGIQGFIFSDFVQQHGLEHFDASMEAMECFTQFSTSEFAIRPFIEKYPKKAIKQLITWSTNKNHHIRRLASEGSRPRLPWAPPLRAFIDNPQPVLPILENLNADSSEYVRKSVANHLNDISKDHPKLALGIAKKWYDNSKNTNWIVKHGLRTLLKKGDKNALGIFGLDNSKELSVASFVLSEKAIKIGEFIHFQFTLHNKSNKKRNVRLEYNIDFVKANKKTSPKMFQIAEFSMPAKGSKEIIRKQAFHDLSTRKHYRGKHLISILVNGDVKGSTSLELN